MWFKQDFAARIAMRKDVAKKAVTGPSGQDATTVRASADIRKSFPMRERARGAQKQKSELLNHAPFRDNSGVPNWRAMRL